MATGRIERAPSPKAASSSARGSPTRTYAWSRHSWPRWTIWCFGVRTNVPPVQHAARHAPPERALEASCRPARLLAPVGDDRNRELLGHDQVFQVRGPPASQLRPVAEVEVFGQGVGGPAPRVHDRRPAPDAGRACEVDEVSGG